MEKYMVPSLPSTQHILEDLSDIDIMKPYSNQTKFQESNDLLKNAHTCYLNFQQLQSNLSKQDELNDKLDELNQQLVENISIMKNQT